MIYIIRHGQTELNTRNVLQGRSDHPLNETGVRQAMEAAERLKGIVFTAVYSSPLIRAIRTAEIIAPALEPVIDERLIEMEYGPYEGKGLRELGPEVMTFFRDFVHNPWTAWCGEAAPLWRTDAGQWRTSSYQPTPSP